MPASAAMLVMLVGLGLIYFALTGLGLFVKQGTTP